MSKIEWTERTWNPVTGCTKISAGCKNCYAERMAKRLKGRYGYPADDPFKVTLRHDRLNQPSTWRKPSKIFVNSMSDLFHVDVPREFISDVYTQMIEADQHTYQVLTKRAARAYRFLNVVWGWRTHPPPKHIWHGITTENQATYDDRAHAFCAASSHIKFLSCEPLLGPIDLHQYLGAWDWVIVGCESGPGRRPFELGWAQSIVAQCQEARVPVFVKQIPINGKVSKDPLEWPEDLRIREYPEVA